MDNLALLISYVENEGVSAGNYHTQPTKKQCWKNPQVWLKVIGFCLSLFTICLSAGAAGAATARVNARNGLNVRTGPSINYPKVYNLRNGKIVNTSGRFSNGWAQLGNGHWVANKYLNYSSTRGGTGGGAPLIRTVASYTHGANIRSGPGTGYRKINYFHNGTRLSLTGRVVRGWHELTRGRGWIAGTLLHSGSSSGGGTGGGTGGGAPLIRTVASYTHGANIRSGPGTGYRKINYFHNGTRLSFTGRVVHGWHELTRDRGWIAGTLLRT